jgi:triacylglycerol lipase
MKELFEKTDSGPWVTSGRDVQYRIERSGNNLFLCFQRTVSKGDWGYNFKFLPDIFGVIFGSLANLFPKHPYKRMPVLWFAHRGFVLLWQSVRDEVIAAVSKHFDTGATSIVVLGYSQGAALATLAHEDIRISIPHLPLLTYAFASPRVLWLPAKKIRERFSNLSHYSVRGDIVTMVPFVWMGFRHVGTGVKIGPPAFPSARHHYPDQYLEYLSP